MKLLDKMYKYEMDPMSILEVTERTQMESTDRWTEGQTDGQGETSISLFQLHWSEGMKSEGTHWVDLSFEMATLHQFTMILNT